MRFEKFLIKSKKSTLIYAQAVIIYFAIIRSSLASTLNRLNRQRADTLRFSFFHDHARDYKGYLSAGKLVGMRRSSEPGCREYQGPFNNGPHFVEKNCHTRSRVSLELRGEERRG